jgi:hypothetical protein
MATRNIVPRATGEGSLGTSAKHWGNIYADNGTIAGRNIANDGVMLATHEAEITNLQSQVTTLEHAYAGAKAAATVADMTDRNQIYVYVGSETGYTNGNWYYWNGTAWTSGGVYNATALETDKTLTVSGAAADAEVTGLVRDGVITHYNEAGTFAPFGQWVHGRMINGEIIQDFNSRVSNDFLFCFDKDIVISVKDGYKYGIHYFENGVFTHDEGGWLIINRYIPKGTQFKLVIAKSDNTYIQRIEAVDSLNFHTEKGVFLVSGWGNTTPINIDDKTIFLVYTKNGDNFTVEDIDFFGVDGNVYAKSLAVFKTSQRLVSADWNVNLRSAYVRLKDWSKAQDIYVKIFNNINAQNNSENEFDINVAKKFVSIQLASKYYNKCYHNQIKLSKLNEIEACSISVGSSFSVMTDDGSDFIPQFLVVYLKNGTNVINSLASLHTSSRTIVANDDDIVGFSLIGESAQNITIIVNTTQVDSVADDSNILIGEPIRMIRPAKYKQLFTITRTSNASGMNVQGGTAYGKFFFQCYAKSDDSANYMEVYDIFTGKLVYGCSLAGGGHCDSIQFGGFYNQNDEFPLLYVTSDHTPCVIYVNRLIVSNGIMSSMLVKTLEFTLENSGYYASASIDNNNSILYTTGYLTDNPSSGDAMKVCAYDLTSETTLENGNKTLSLLDTFTTDFIYVAQGQIFYDNKIYTVSSSSASIDGYMYVIDTEKRKIVTKYRMANFKDEEIETLGIYTDVDGYDKFIISTQSSKVYNIDFN